MMNLAPTNVHKNDVRRKDPMREQDARKIASMLARGNVLLQDGSFETEQDVDARRNELKDYEF